MSSLRTERLDLRLGSVELLHADLAGTAELTEALGVPVPETWPPEFYDADAIRSTLTLAERYPESVEWGLYYIIARDVHLPHGAQGPCLVGAGGFKGPPDANGEVQIGYSIVPDYQRRGYATEATLGWVAYAFAAPEVRVVIAHTVASLPASIRVLTRAGFEADGTGSDPNAPPDEEVLRFILRRPAGQQTP